jgi:hypothetical protein
MYRQPQASPRMPTTMVEEPTASEALVHAWNELNEAREALARADGDRQAECARLAIDAAATVLADPAAAGREVVVAHCFLREALALDGRPNTCGVECIDTIDEVSSLSPEDQRWLPNYLLPTPVGDGTGVKRGIRRALGLGKGKRAAAMLPRQIGGEHR